MSDCAVQAVLAAAMGTKWTASWHVAWNLLCASDDGMLLVKGTSTIVCHTLSDLKLFLKYCILSSLCASCCTELFVVGCTIYVS